MPGILIVVNTAALKCFLSDLGKMDAPMELAVVPLLIIFYLSRMRRVKRDKSLSAAAPRRPLLSTRPGEGTHGLPAANPFFWEAGDSPPAASQQSEGTLIPEP